MTDEQKYSIVVKNKIFATNLTLKQCMKLSVYLGRKGINHSEKILEVIEIQDDIGIIEYEKD